MLWECERKHTWSAILNMIKDRGTWCPECYGKKKLNGLKVAREIAGSYGGKCLSTEYVNIITKMLWECKERHRWKTSLNHVRNSNSWCPYCANVKIDGLKKAQMLAKK